MAWRKFATLDVFTTSWRQEIEAGRGLRAVSDRALTPTRGLGDSVELTREGIRAGQLLAARRVELADTGGVTAHLVAGTSRLESVARGWNGVRASLGETWIGARADSRIIFPDCDGQAGHAHLGAACLGDGVVDVTLARDKRTACYRTAIYLDNGCSVSQIKPFGRGVTRGGGTVWIFGGGETRDVIPAVSSVGALLDWAIAFGSFPAGHVKFTQQRSTSSHLAIRLVLEIKPRTWLRLTASDGASASTGAEPVNIVLIVIRWLTVAHWTAAGVCSVACVVLSGLGIGAFGQGAGGSRQCVKVPGGSGGAPSDRTVVACGEPSKIMLARFGVGARYERTFVGKQSANV